MIPKGRNTLYLFDFMDTLFKKEYYSVLKFFRSREYINPDDYGIRWSVLTEVGCPWIVKVLCNINGLYPKNIIRVDAKDKTEKEQAKKKSEIIIDILSGKNSNLVNVEKLFYIDSDEDVIKNINETLVGFPAKAISILTFKEGNFHFYI